MLGDLNSQAMYSTYVVLVVKVDWNVLQLGDGAKTVCNTHWSPVSQLLPKNACMLIQESKVTSHHQVLSTASGFDLDM